MTDAPRDRADDFHVSVSGFPAQGSEPSASKGEFAEAHAEEMLLRDERADADAERADLYVASPARNACHVDAAAGERTLWPELALSHTPQIGGFLRGLEGGGDTAFPASDTLRLGSRESLESLIGDATSTSDYKEDMRPPSGAEGKGTEPSLASDLLPMSAPCGGVGAEEEMRLPEELIEHFYCPPSDATPEHSAYFVGLPPFVPKVKADLSSNLASSMAEGVVSETLVNVFMGKVAERDSWYQCGVDGTCERQEASSLPPAGPCSTSSVYTAFAGLLPQKTCCICGDEASGCHYGVLTCGSCKVFFKRAVEGHQKYLCAGRNDCIVDKIRRKNCPACRLRKCYQAGMMLGGQRLKKFGALKPMALTLTAPPGLTLSRASLDMVSMARVPTIRELNASPQIISILENIEPEVVLSEHDSSLPDLPHHLLNSLNRLCEKQLLWIVKWSKLLPGFRSLHINDQMCLIQHSWMNLMLFSLGWMSFKNTTRGHLYFAPDLVMNEVRMKQSPIAHLCTAIQLIPHEFDKLQLTREEFLCMKALMLLTVVPMEGLKSQKQFEEMRQNYIRELSKAMQLKARGAAGALQRSSRLARLMETMHEIQKKVNLYCLSIFVQADVMQVEFPEMMSEVITSQLPRLLAGMVKPLPLVFERK